MLHKTVGVRGCKEYWVGHMCSAGDKVVPLFVVFR